MLFGAIFLIDCMNLIQDIVGDTELRLQNGDSAEGTMVRTTTGKSGKLKGQSVLLFDLAGFYAISTANVVAFFLGS